MKRKIISLILMLALAISLIACGSKEEKKAETETKTENSGTTAENTKENPTESPAASEEKPEKILKVAASFAYESLDVHKEYYGWYTSIYGNSETLFRMNEASEAENLLVDSVSIEGTVWTFVLKDGVAFSNGNTLTADMVVRNYKRIAEVNSGFAYLADFDISAKDDKTVVFDTKEVYPTLKNDLASPELGMIDLDATTDFDLNPVCTGPFVLDTFVPAGDVTVKKNANYWGGEVKLDGAVFYYMQDDDSKLIAMQSGEIDGYNSISAAALAVYGAEPDKYNVVKIPGTRLQYYILNENTLDDAVREAINLTVDKEAIAAFLQGAVTAAAGPFSVNAAYGKVTVPAVDTAKAKALLEADGYQLNGDGLYEKDGKVLSINIAYYAARSLDTIALLIQEQLKAIGVDSTLTCEEDPDATYIANSTFDLALYCMIADKSGDPLYFIESTLAEGAYYNCGGFESAECQAMINELMYEVDTAKRAELANRIVQIAIDDNAFGYVGLFSHSTVLKPGVSGFAENLPFDFYGVDANTDIQ